MQRLYNFLFGISILLMLGWMSSCYYDNEEELYPQTPVDSVSVSYSADVAPVMNDFCVSCHGEVNAQGNIQLYNHETTSAYALSAGNNYICALRHGDNCLAMPLGGNKLSTTTVDKIEIWVLNGAPNN